MPKLFKLHLSWLKLFTQTALAIYAYVFMEWLFFATKPSFMDALPLMQKLEIFLLTALAPALLALPVLIVLRLLGFIPGVLKRWQVFLFIGGILPAVIYAGLSLLLIDNFTYTLFKFGIVNSQGVWRGGYALLEAAFLLLWYRQVLRNIHISNPVDPTISHPKRITWQKAQTWLVLALFVVSLGVGITRFATNVSAAGEINAILQNRPHIILIGSDGLVAKNMSLYGYGRQTTPYLEKLAESSLLMEDNWANASTTPGSVFSILTGRDPATTRMLYMPDILQGENAYLHLPGILLRAGYHTVQNAFPYYVDAYAVNLQEGFDEVNGRRLDQSSFPILARQYQLEDISYFLPRLYERISDRLLHIFYIRPMPDPYSQVLKPVDPDSIPMYSDEKKINDTLRLLRNAIQPTFVNVHLMGTHGEEFDPTHRVFSKGKKQSRAWMTDFYDDSIVDFDFYIKQLVDGLEKNGLLDQTVIILYADHADQWRADDKVPLLIHFPRGDYAGRINTNTQNLDIAPTVLDYLGMDKPAWMPGKSLLKGEPPSLRPIFSSIKGDEICEGWWCRTDPKYIKPPFYQFAAMQMVVCQEMYTLFLRTNYLEEKTVRDQTAPCQTEDLPSREQARAMIREYLNLNGFDVTSIK